MSRGGRGKGKETSLGGCPTDSQGGQKLDRLSALCRPGRMAALRITPGRGRGRPRTFCHGRGCGLQLPEASRAGRPRSFPPSRPVSAQDAGAYRKEARLPREREALAALCSRRWARRCLPPVAGLPEVGSGVGAALRPRPWELRCSVASRGSARGGLPGPARRGLALRDEDVGGAPLSPGQPRC